MHILTDNNFDRYWYGFDEEDYAWANESLVDLKRFKRIILNRKLIFEATGNSLKKVLLKYIVPKYNRIIHNINHQRN